MRGTTSCFNILIKILFIQGCKDLVAKGLTKAEKEAILQAHNNLRNNV